MSGITHPAGGGAILQVRGAARNAYAQALPVSMLLGAAMSMSLAPAEAWWFAAPCLAGLFYLLPALRPLQRAACGWAFGLGWFGAGLWWVVPGLASTSEAGAALSLTLGALLIAYLALYPAAAALAIGALQGERRPWLRAAATASAWTLCDWLRAHLLGGMPMLPSGAAHASGPLAGYAALAGVHGLGFLNAMSAAVLAQWLPTGAQGRSAQHGRMAGRPCQMVRPRIAWPPRQAAIGLLALGALLLGGQLLRQHAWTRDAGTLDIRILQGDLQPDERSGREAVLRAHTLYSHLAAAGSADLTVLPETALPIEWDAMPPAMLAEWQALAERNGAILLGAMAAAVPRPGLIGASSNSAFALQGVAAGDSPARDSPAWPGHAGSGLAHRGLARPDRATLGLAPVYRYDKAELVPLGERMPQSMDWLAQRLNVQFGGLLPGARGQAPLRLERSGARVAIGICYENQFGPYLARQARDAHLLAILNNLAWGRGSYAAAQYTQASQLRALETGRWVVQASNGGPSVLISPSGAIVDALPDQATGVLTGRAGLRDGATPYMRTGDAPLLLAMLSILSCCAWRRRCP
ncbi:apolipoprotein N-acyltransferase [Oxalobacteraceae bacterium A2-2]